MLSGRDGHPGRCGGAALSAGSRIAWRCERPDSARDRARRSSDALATAIAEGLLAFIRRAALWVLRRVQTPPRGHPAAGVAASHCGTTPGLARMRGPSASGSIPRTRSAPSVIGDTQPIIRIADVLPSAVGAEEPERLPASHVHIDPVDRRVTVEPFAQTASVDERFGPGRFEPRPRVQRMCGPASSVLVRVMMPSADGSPGLPCDAQDHERGGEPAQLRCYLPPDPLVAPMLDLGRDVGGRLATLLLFDDPEATARSCSPSPAAAP